jgi:L-malate glycosyltransferase
MSDVALTVLFATRNGEHVLPRTLEAYCRVEEPSHAWKIVIVDNGSSDLTPSILTSFKKHLPLETIRHPVAGKSRALNSGLSALEGRLAILTDDDAIPASSFLTAWSRYLDICEDYEIFGGSIHARFEARPPKWIVKNEPQFDMLFAARDLPEGPIAPDEIFGPNMAVRSSVFVSGFRFNESIGPNGSDEHYPMGSETEFCCRVAQSGAKAWFAREPLVQHLVRSDQVTATYWAERAYRHGRGEARRVWQFGQPLPPSISRPFMLDQLACLRHRLQMFSPFPLQRLNSVRAYHWRRGFRDEWAKTANTRNQPPD